MGEEKKQGKSKVKRSKRSLVDKEPVLEDKPEPVECKKPIQEEKQPVREVDEEPHPKKEKHPMITLMSRELVTCNVSHENYCEKIGECQCVSLKIGRARRNRNTGIRGMAFSEKKFNPSISFPAFVKYRVPEALRDDPEIAKAIAEKRLRVVR